MPQRMKQQRLLTLYILWYVEEHEDGERKRLRSNIVLEGTGKRLKRESHGYKQEEHAMDVSAS